MNTKSISIYERFPKVIIEDFALFIKLGECLNLLTKRQINEYLRLLFSIYRANKSHTPVAIPETISSKVIDIVAMGFSVILASSGIASSEICTLSKINNSRTIVECNFKSGKKAQIALSCDDKDHLSSLTILQPGLNESFGFFDEEEFKKSNLQPESRTIFVTEDILYSRYFSWDSSHFTLDRPDYNLELMINPLEEDKEFKKAIVLPCEFVLESYLCSLQFPFDITEVLSSIMSITCTTRYQDIKLKIKRKESKECFELVERPFRFEQPGIKLAKTKDEIRLSISKDLNWDESIINTLSDSLNNRNDEGLPPSR